MKKDNNASPQGAHDWIEVGRGLVQQAEVVALEEGVDKRFPLLPAADLHHAGRAGDVLTYEIGVCQ
jgi:hypothetical protein